MPDDPIAIRKATPDACLENQDQNLCTASMFFQAGAKPAFDNMQSLKKSWK